MFGYSVGSFAVKQDKVALAIPMPAVFNYKWCIKCGECNIDR
jgi:hypothetical protein